MSQVADLDVLVVYSADAAISASVEDSVSRHPFLIDSKQSNYNLSYAYFLQKCQDVGLSAGFAASSDIIGPGTCSCYWRLEADKWIKVKASARSKYLFDKLSPSCDMRLFERELLLSGEVVPFNDPDVFATFFDKLSTYKRLSEYAIPTVGISSSRKDDIAAAVSRLKSLIRRHPLRQDFAPNLILKDRFGAGGNNVYKVEADAERQIQTIMRRNHEVRFVIQPFLLFDRGHRYENRDSSVDIRLIFLRNELVQSYIRVAQDNNFLCNEHQGGVLTYIPKNDVPMKVQTVAQKIVAKIGKDQSLYALDFVVSNRGNVYFVEGNTGPGIDWDVTREVNEIKSKQLINEIVSELQLRVEASKDAISNFGLELPQLIS